MNDYYLRYGFYVRGFHRALTARQMTDKRVIRWIKNEAARRDIPFRAWRTYLEDYLRDAPIIIIRRRTRDGMWVEAPLPTYRVFECDDHWFEDFVRPVPMEQLPRLPRREAKLRVWVMGSILRAMVNQEKRDR
jgi:hypothetical protein